MMHTFRPSERHPVAASPQANAAGWNNANVTVSFTGTDAISGIASSSSNVTLTAENANQSASGTCSDIAGQKPPYPRDKESQVNFALAEAWNWLERKGLVVRAPGTMKPRSTNTSVWGFENV